MKSVKLTGWKVGLKKISLAKAIQEVSGGSIFEAKKIVEKVLNGEIVCMDVPDEALEEFIENSQIAGVILEISKNADT